MTNDTTTISITTDQKAQLDERKQHERESYKSVITRLLEGGEAGETDPDRVADEIQLLREHIDMVMREPVAEVNADIDGPVELEATEHKKIAESVAEELR